MMMVLGLYVFMLRTVPYQELQYQRSWRHAANSRVNRRPSTQFLGPENDMLTLSGVLMPEITGGRLSLLALEQMAERQPAACYLRHKNTGKRQDRKSTRLNSSHSDRSRMPSSA